jgi:hypothetical protein
MSNQSNVRRSLERGQSTILVVLALSVFLLGFIGFAVDYTNLWFKRQAAQGAADATCQAAGMDLLLLAQGSTTPNMNFTPTVGGSLDCASSSTAAPCIIAQYNGFNGTLAGNTVTMSFPASVDGATAPPGVNVPYVKVDVTQQVPVYFSRLLLAGNTVATHATATCGLSAPLGPVPIVVLHKTSTQAIDMVGNKNLIKIVGGGQRSIQVNSNAKPTSVNLEAIDLSAAGPANTGGDFGLFGGPATNPGSVDLGSTGHWVYPAAPIADPYQDIAAPSQPGDGTKFPKLKGASCSVAVAPKGCYKVDGCPDPNGCDEYTAGYYSGQIQVKAGTAIFQPGVYYIQGGLSLDSNSVVRVTCCGGSADGDGSGGVTFYFSGSGTLNVNANSGKAGLADVYHVNGGTFNGVQNRALKCTGGRDNPPGLPDTIDGNLLLAPCTGTYGDPQGNYRGFLFFQDRSAAASVSWQGGGNFLMAGYMYFHQCRANGTGRSCSNPGSGGYGTTFNLGGNPGSATYTIGSIVTDRIVSNGNPNITMILSPFESFAALKVIFLK